MMAISCEARAGTHGGVAAETENFLKFVHHFLEFPHLLVGWRSHAGKWKQLLLFTNFSRKKLLENGIMFGRIISF